MLELDQLLIQRVKLTGFIVSHHVHGISEFVGRVGGAFEGRRLRYAETVVEGLENARDAARDFFRRQPRETRKKVADPQQL